MMWPLFFLLVTLFFPGIVSITNTSSTTLTNSSGERGDCLLVPDFRVNNFNFSSFSIVLGIDLSCVDFIMLIKWFRHDMFYSVSTEMIISFPSACLFIGSLHIILLICVHWTNLEFLEWNQFGTAVSSLIHF